MKVQLITGDTAVLRSLRQIRHLSSGRRVRLAHKLYWIVGGSLFVVGMLVASAIYLSLLTREAVGDVESRGVTGFVESIHLQEQLVEHRRLVETISRAVRPSPAEIRALAELDWAILALIDRSQRILLTSVRNLVPLLIEQGRALRQLVEQGGPPEKIRDLTTAYQTYWEGVGILFREQGAQRASYMVHGLRHLADNAQLLVLWMMAAGAMAALLIGPVSLVIIHRVLERLEAIALAMVRLAQNDTDIVIPGLKEKDEVGSMARAVSVFKANAIDLLESKSQLQRLNARLDAAIGNMPVGLTMFDAHDRLVVCNELYREMYGYATDHALPGATRQDLLRRLVTSGRIDTDQAVKIERFGPGASDATNTILHMNDGRIISLTRRPTGDGGWVAVHEDISARCQQEARIAHLAGHDTLTGLANRHLMRERIAAALAQAEDVEGTTIHCVDLDGFKAVNDAEGDHVGDQLLKAVGKRLLDCVRGTDMVARMGSDEFSIVQIATNGTAPAELLASRIVEQIAKPFVIDGREIVIGASVGVAISPRDGDTPDQLLKKALIALNFAKANGRGTHALFELEMDNRMQHRRALEADLRAALAKGEFELHYQPIVGLETGSVLAFEALTRWRHPSRGLVPPAEFIPLAEEIGLIIPMGEWAMETACREAARWPMPCNIAVNLSPIQFRSTRLVEMIELALRDSGLEPSRLEVEITESALLQDDPATLAALRDMHRLGVRISMDDFGTGYSSLSYLRSFPFDKIKIDKSFIMDIHNDAEAGPIVEAVVTLASSLNMQTLAEGVETPEQREALRRAGCQQAQGYLFSRPVPASEIVATLARLTTPEQKVA